MQLAIVIRGYRRNRGNYTMKNLRGRINKEIRIKWRKAEHRLKKKKKKNEEKGEKHYWNRIICLLQCPAKMAAGEQEQFQQLLTGLLSVDNKVRQQAEVSITWTLQE